MVGESGTHQAREFQTVSRTEEDLRLLLETGLSLASERRVDTIAEIALYAGLRLSGATLGAFFITDPAADGLRYHLRKLHAVDPALGIAALPDPAALFPAGTITETCFCSDDATRDPRYQRPSDAPDPFVRSLIATLVRSREGTTLGALLLGHAEPRHFAAHAHRLVDTLAAQSAAALENARLAAELTRQTTQPGAATADRPSTERRLRDALGAAQLGTWTWNASTDLLDFDERGAKLFSLPPHELVARASLRQRSIFSEDLAPGAAGFEETLRRGGTYSAEYRITSPEGAQCWIASTGAPVLNEASGEITGMTGIVQDITLRKTQESSLRTSEKLAATGRLAATIAHEINNPLEAVTNLIYLAKTDPITPSSIASLLETADDELARVTHIAQQTLGFYRDTTQPVHINLNELLQGVVDLFRRKLTGKRLQCRLDLEPQLTIRGLQGEIRQVVSNLLVNAIDASATGGHEIRIRGRHRHRNGNRGVSVIISDEGAGIPSHLRSSLFTPFVTSKQSLGTGLGLWVTQGIVEKHGGTVRFRSRTDHPSGTVFRVFLPGTEGSAAFTSPMPSVLQ